MKKFISSSLLGLASLSILTPLAFASTDQQSAITGYWAMHPLPDDGLANVAYFDGKGNSLLYPFKCNFQEKTSTALTQPIKFNYNITDNLLNLSNDEMKLSQQLFIHTITEDTLILEQHLPNNETIIFKSQKVFGVKNLCPTP